MKKFTDLRLVQVNDYRFETIDDTYYYLEDDERSSDKELVGLLGYDKSLGKYIITIPKGFTTDLASVPRIFWSVYPPFGRYTSPAVLHDYLYSLVDSGLGSMTYKYADKLFLRSMREIGVSRITRNILYYSVRLYSSVLIRLFRLR